MDDDRPRVRIPRGATAGVPSGDAGATDPRAGLSLADPVTRLTLLCHGATRATRAAAFPTADDPLAPRALASLPGLADSLGHADRCWTSPAACARATAAALRLAARDEPLLRDCDYGRWAGKGLDAVSAAEPDALAAWLADPEARPHGGEALTGVAKRVNAWLAACADGGGHPLAVTHPLVIRIAAAIAIGAPLGAVWRLDVAPLSRTRLTAQAGRWRLAAFNETGGRGRLALPPSIP